MTLNHFFELDEIKRGIYEDEGYRNFRYSVGSTTINSTGLSGKINKNPLIRINKRLTNKIGAINWPCRDWIRNNILW